MDSKYNELVDSFVEKNFDNFKADLKSLVDIKSIAGAPMGDAPYGLGVERALHRALELAQRVGMEPTDCNGHIGYAHYGNPEKFIGIIGHVDVVPEGAGWNTDPYSLTECGGYLLGRGTLDDKGGFVIGLYTAKFLIENKIPLKYGIRLIAGCDEEVGMSDIEYYCKNCDMPAFTLVPDTEFPVCHGEKGIYSADIRSLRPLSPAVKSISGGLASNVVPERAVAVIDCPIEAATKAAEGHKEITIFGENGEVTVNAMGLSAHAGDPDGGINAIVLLCRFLCENKLVPDTDAELLCHIYKTFEVNDGSRLGITADDGIFTPLTCIGGMIKLDDDRKVVQNMNVRYPTTITDKQITENICENASKMGFELINIEDGNGPHYIPAESPEIQALTSVYNAETGRDDKPYVMSGGTYARHIPHAAAFGPHFIFEKRPDFVGDVHCKNEGASIELTKLALKIYIKALIELQNVEL